MTQLESARKGKITDAMRRVADAEGLPAELIRDRVASGLAVIPVNRDRHVERPCGIGLGLRVKVNANIGTSGDYPDEAAEIEKLEAALEAGADTVMDLSTGGDIAAVRRHILSATPVPVGTVPIYEAVIKSARAGKQGIKGLTSDDIIESVRDHCRDGVDFATLHCGVTRQIVDDVVENPRHCGIVSRGGTFLAAWMQLHEQENPLLERYDEVLDILREYDVTISLGDGMRPGALADSFDRPQVQELHTIARLAERARRAGVQAMIEGPGHVPLHHVTAQVRLQKAVCGGAPFYVLGPLVTDVAPGYDHISAAIGGAVAAAAGADFLCYVTPAEHLGLPDVQHVREGVMATRIAAHAADIARGHPNAAGWDRDFAALRKERNWAAQIEKSMDPLKAREIRDARSSRNGSVCSMCGEYCVFKIAKDLGLSIG